MLLIEWITKVYTGVDELKHGYIAGNQAAQLPTAPITGTVPSTTAQSATHMPVK